MTPENPLLEQLLDGTGRLRVSLPCVHCGYDLRTLPNAGTCPECGAAVEQSLALLVRHPHPGALATRLSTGVCMLALGQTMVAATALAPVLLVVLRSDAGYWAVLTLAPSGAILIALAGLWLATVPRRLSLEPPARRAASIHGWVQCAGAVGLVSWYGLLLATTPEPKIWTPLLFHLGAQVSLLPPASLHRLLALLLEALAWPAVDLRRLRWISHGFAAAWTAALVGPFSELARRALREQHWPLWRWIPSEVTWIGVAVAAWFAGALLGSIVTWRIWQQLARRHQRLRDVLLALRRSAGDDGPARPADAKGRKPPRRHPEL